MKLTRQAEIGIQLLVLCARKGPSVPVNTRMAAEFAGTTKDHAAQAVAKLTRAGFLIGIRGRAGGIKLAVAPANINVGEAIRAIEPTFGEVEEETRIGRGNSFEVVVRAAVDSFVATFDTFTIADLVAPPQAGRINCLDCDLHTLARRGRSFSSFRLDPSTSRKAALEVAHAA